MFRSRNALLGFCLGLVSFLAVGSIAAPANADGYRHRSHNQYHSSYNSHRYHSSYNTYRHRPSYKHYHYRSRYHNTCRPQSYRPYYHRTSGWNHYNAGHYRYRGSHYYGSHRLSRLHR